MNTQVIERCHKETEETLAIETVEFLQQPISYLKEKQEEFIYVEASEFTNNKMDAIVLEFDQTFNVYTALFGLHLQKKVSEPLKSYLRDHLKGMLGSSSAMFNGTEGLWEVNIALDAIEGFTGEETMMQSMQLVVQFVEQLLQEVAA